MDAAMRSIPQAGIAVQSCLSLLPCLTVLQARLHSTQAEPITESAPRTTGVWIGRDFAGVDHMRTCCCVIVLRTQQAHQIRDVMGTAPAAKCMVACQEQCSACSNSGSSINGSSLHQAVSAEPCRLLHGGSGCVLADKMSPGNLV